MRLKHLDACLLGRQPLVVSVLASLPIPAIWGWFPFLPCRPPAHCQSLSVLFESSPTSETKCKASLAHQTSQPANTARSSLHTSIFCFPGKTAEQSSKERISSTSAMSIWLPQHLLPLPKPNTASFLSTTSLIPGVSPIAGMICNPVVSGILSPQNVTPTYLSSHLVQIEENFSSEVYYSQE